MVSTSELSGDQVRILQDLAHQLRIHAIESTTTAKSGHPTSCSSMAEIMSVLFFNVMRYDVDKPKAASNDRFVLSKGHAAPILYAAWAEAGLFPTTELAKLRKLESDLEGHPTPRLNFVDVATGSLGQGLSVACGMAYAGKHYDKANYRTFCLMGDGESMEGNVWEAMTFAGFYKLDNLVAIVDINRLGQSDPTPLAHDLDAYRARVESFGFHAIVVNGHDVVELANALHEASETKGKPTCILARTFKGHAFPDIEDQMNWHGKALPADISAKVVDHIKSLMSGQPLAAPKPQPPLDSESSMAKLPASVALSSSPAYALGDKIATRQAYGTALVKLADSTDRLIALDGDMKNSTFSQDVRKKYPERHVECFICEQNLAGVGIGLACRDRCIAFVSTFACFLTRAFDNFRMGVISQTNVNVAGSHCGVSIGEDGPSQMALEDLAMFRTLPGCTVFYPSDAVSTERAIELAANTPGITYIRLSRPATPVIYANDQKFAIGKANLLREPTAEDQVLIIAAGITMAEAVAAADELKAQAGGISVRLMDIFTVKPLDKEAVIEHGLACHGRILTVEDHYPEGGIGSAVADVVAERKDLVLKKLCVREVPRSGTPAQLVEKYGIGRKSIVEAVKLMVE